MRIDQIVLKKLLAKLPTKYMLRVWVLVTQTVNGYKLVLVTLPFSLTLGMELNTGLLNWSWKASRIIARHSCGTPMETQALEFLLVQVVVLVVPVIPFTLFRNQLHWACWHLEVQACSPGDENAKLDFGHHIVAARKAHFTRLNFKFKALSLIALTSVSPPSKTSSTIETSPG